MGQREADPAQRPFLLAVVGPAPVARVQEGHRGQAQGPADDIQRALQNITGVTRVALTESRDSEATYQVDSDKGVDVRREVAAIIVRGGWGLLELRPSRLSLEDVFVKLMTDENTEIATSTSENAESTEVAGA